MNSGRDERANYPSRYAIKTESLLTNPYEAVIFGNGDVGASLNISSHEMLITLGKNDAWDARLHQRAEDVALRHDDLIRYERENGFSWLRSSFDPHPDEHQAWREKPEDAKVHYGTEVEPVTFPSPKRLGYIRVDHPGLSDTRVESRLDIATGMLGVVYHLPGAKLHIEAFVHKARNVVLVKVRQEGSLPWVRIAVGKQPDAKDPRIPPAEVRRTDDASGVITQRIPAGYDLEAFAWHLACSFSDKAPVDPWACELRQHCYLADGDTVTLSLGIATDRDGHGDSLDRAIALSQVDYGRAAQESREYWADFWSRSAIALDDKELEAAWYRNMFGYACQVGASAQAPGLQANVPTDDISPWRGCYTWNHNVQKWFLPALPTNHPEWIDSYASLIEQSTPSFEYLAKLIFGLDGVYCDLCTFPFTPPHRSYVNNKWGRALAVTGWLGQPLWWHWEYTRDIDWLRTRAYPYLKRAAQFYWNYLEKYQDESGDIYPSMRLEQPGWGEGFVGNRNVITDLVMFRKAFEWAAAAAEILDTDADWIEKWRAGIGRIPEIEFGRGPDDEAWLALDKHWMSEPLETFRLRTRDYTGEMEDFKFRTSAARETRWGGAGFVVFPGEHVAGDEEEGLAPVIRDLLSRADISDPKFTLVKPHAVTSVLPRIRLGLFDDFDKIRELVLTHRFASGQHSGVQAGKGDLPVLHFRGSFPPRHHASTWRFLENQYLGVVATTEMLLQSQGGVIRLFPFWPKDQSASFADFRARGGFLVSASYIANRGLGTATILSLSGQPCHVRWIGTDLPRVEQTDGPREASPMELSYDGQTLSFETTAGYSYRIESTHRD